jgi:IclR family transcriptional regulator, acetate operon repressor
VSSVDYLTAPIVDVKTAVRTLDLFEAFETLRRPASLSELADEIGMPVSSCFALVRTMQRRGYLYSLRDRGPLYPTGRLLTVARAVAEHDVLYQRLSKRLAALRDTCGETVVIGTLNGREALYIDVFESQQQIRYSPRPGARRPAHANSIAKAVIGVLPADERARILQTLEYRKLTSRTILGASRLESDLAKATRRGWFTNLGESAADLAAVAVPIAINGDWFGISIAGPLQRIRPRMISLAKSLREIVRSNEDARAR